MARPENIALFVLIGLLLAISLVDIRRRIIPDALNLSLGVAGLCTAWFARGDLPLASLANALLYFGIFWLVRQSFYRVTGRVGLGLGDVKLAGASGCWLGLTSLSAFVGIASASALLFILLHRIIRTDPPDERLPFAPFMSLALAASWLIETNAMLVEEFPWN
jgi:leader peptidase (prepilin peptidase)/N-methyltransferase